MSRPTFLEFFAGAGMARQGLLAAWDCAWANDISENKARIYRANFGDAELEVGDVSDVDPKTLPIADLAWASFPCQDLSLAGARGGMHADRSGSFWGFWSVVDELHAFGRRPPIIVVENVVGLLHGGFPAVCEAFAAFGMQFGALQIDARHFVPQSRPRIFLIAVDSTVDSAPFVRRWPEATWSSPALKNAVNRLPTTLEKQWLWWRLPTPTGPTAHLVDIIDEQSNNWYPQGHVARLTSMMSPRNTEKLTQAEHSGGEGIGFLYRRMRGGQQRAEVRFDGLAGCLRTPAGGSSRQTVVLVGPEGTRMRLLTAREGARLMGLPRAFRLTGSETESYRAMADGVVVPLVSWLSEKLLLPMVAKRVQATGSLVRCTGYQTRSRIRAAAWLNDNGGRVSDESERHSSP